MKNEYNVNRVQYLEKAIKDLKDKIRSHVGLIPQTWWVELDSLEVQLIKTDMVK